MYINIKTTVNKHHHHLQLTGFGYLFRHNQTMHGSTQTIIQYAITKRLREINTSFTVSCIYCNWFYLLQSIYTVLMVFISVEISYPIFLIF